MKVIVSALSCDLVNQFTNFSIDLKFSIKMLVMGEENYIP